MISVARVTPSMTEDDYQELLERLRMADFLYTEYSLEEVIYQLAKVMFSQSLVRGNINGLQPIKGVPSILRILNQSKYV